MVERATQRFALCGALILIRMQSYNNEVRVAHLIVVALHANGYQQKVFWIAQLGENVQTMNDIERLRKREVCVT